MLRLLARPRWIALSLLVVVLVVAFVELGLWQLRRLEDRRTTNAAIISNESATPVPVEQLSSRGAAEWTRVRAEGRYETASELLVRNRPLNGSNGFQVVTPLVTEDDRRLLVLRGWIPAGDTAVETPDVPPPPPGEITVTGRLRASETARRALQADAPRQVTALDTRAIGDLLGEPVYDGYLELTAQDPPAGTVPTPLPPPETSEGPHLAYAIQWFAFAIIAVGGWVMLSRSELVDSP